jgi:hypothetical protein
MNYNPLQKRKQKNQLDKNKHSEKSTKMHIVMKRVFFPLERQKGAYKGQKQLNEHGDIMHVINKETVTKYIVATSNRHHSDNLKP